MRTETTTSFAFATVFAVAALALVSVAFGTNHWWDTFVNRDKLQTVDSTVLCCEPEFFTQYRGLFRTCFPGNDTDQLLLSIDHVVDSTCVAETGYGIPRDPVTTGYGPDYDVRMHLMRSHFAAMVLAIFFFLICCLMGVAGCWNASPRLVRSTGILMFFGMFFVAAGMALFHGYYYLEENKLTEMPNTSAYIKKKAENDQYKLLDENRSAYPGYSYIVSWLGLGMAAISGILYLVVAYQLSVDKMEEKMGPADKRIRNRAYDYMDQYPYDDYYAANKAAYPQGAYAQGAYPQGAYPQQAAYANAAAYPQAYPEAGYGEALGYDYGGYTY